MPKLFDGEYTPHTISLREDHKILLLKIGKGSITHGIRVLLLKYTEDLDNDFKKTLLEKKQKTIKGKKK
jgi:hypothetical protein